MHIADRYRRGFIEDRKLTPEEDSIGDPDETEDEIDDLLPGDLWFRALWRKTRRSTGQRLNRSR